MSNRAGVIVDVRVEERLRIDVPTENGIETVTISLEHKSGQVARLRIQAAEPVTIRPPRRRELPVVG